MKFDVGLEALCDVFAAAVPHETADLAHAVAGRLARRAPPAASPGASDVESAPQSSRRRLWELPRAVLCPVLGTCVSIEQLRRLAEKVLGRRAQADDYALRCTARCAAPASWPPTGARPHAAARWVLRCGCCAVGDADAPVLRCAGLPARDREPRRPFPAPRRRRRGQHRPARRPPGVGLRRLPGALPWRQCNVRVSVSFGMLMRIVIIYTSATQPDARNCCPPRRTLLLFAHSCVCPSVWICLS